MYITDASFGGVNLELLNSVAIFIYRIALSLQNTADIFEHDIFEHEEWIVEKDTSSGVNS